MPIRQRGLRDSSGTGDVATVENKRTWWKPNTWFGWLPSLRGAPAWLISLAFHMAALVALVLIPLYLPIRNRVSLSIVPTDGPDESVAPQEFHFSPAAHDRVGRWASTDWMRRGHQRRYKARSRRSNLT